MYRKLNKNIQMKIRQTEQTETNLNAIRKKVN